MHRLNTTQILYATQNPFNVGVSMSDMFRVSGFRVYWFRFRVSGFRV